jgi:hypothetical protein
MQIYLTQLIERERERETDRKRDEIYIERAIERATADLEDGFPRGTDT